MKYILPDLEKEYLIMYKNKFLELNNLKIGDKVVIPFKYHQLKSKYKSRKMERYTYEKECEGILIEDLDGALIAESIDELAFYDHKSNGFSGRNYKEWYQLNKRKSIYKFGRGFIY